MDVAPVKPSITIDVLERIDIRVGTIQRVDDVAGSKKLVKLTVGFGDRTRSILAVVALLLIGPLGGMASIIYAVRIEPLKALKLA